MRKLILINLQHQLVQCGTVQYNAQEQTQKIEIRISTYNPPLLMTRSSSRARQPLSRVNLTGFPFLNSGKNRKYLSISIKNLKTSLKTGFAQISLAAQNFGGSCSPPRPPGPYAYAV